MGNKLKPGGLGLKEDPQPIPSAFASSMAAAMEEALNKLLIAEDRPAVPVDNSTETRDRRILFVAIAQGIVNHLVANEAAFVIRNDLGDKLGGHNMDIDHDS